MKPTAALWLRIEGCTALLASVLLYAQHGRGWLFFLILLFLPDLSMIGYVAGARFGAAAYNIFHTYSVPLLLGAISFALHHGVLASIALIWFAHIGLDRTLGYGLKSCEGFHQTHLGPIGQRRAHETRKFLDRP